MDLTSGQSFYGPNDIQVRERNGTTEYMVPGKGSATFQGQRKGGGSLSVVSGRTAEDQQAIDQTVSGINRQIDAMRSLNGKPSQAEEARMQTIQAIVDQYYPENSEYADSPQYQKMRGDMAAEIAKVIAAQESAQGKAQQDEFWRRANYGQGERRIAADQENRQYTRETGERSAKEKSLTSHYQDFLDAQESAIANGAPEAMIDFFVRRGIQTPSGKIMPYRVALQDFMQRGMGDESAFRQYLLSTVASLNTAQ
jgi:hypothetical protein